MWRSWVLFAVFCLSLSAQASLVETFESLADQRKGPFTLNYLQGPRDRVVVNRGYPSRLQFQAAFRNDIGRALAENYDFYVANLFTTNYYELMGEFVYGEAYGSHELDHQGLIQQGTASVPKASSMVRHWVLEKYYVHYFPRSPLARAFTIRGISGSEFELEYANYFFNYYLSVYEDEFQYLPAFLLIQNSPVTESSSLERARSMVSDAYDYFAERWGSRDERVRRMYEIRNAIHNQLSPQVIGMIDRYVEDYPFYREEGHTYLFRIREMLVEYYSFDAGKLAETAQELGLTDLAEMARQVGEPAANLEALLRLSQELAQLRTWISDESRIAYENKTEALVLLSQASQYLNKELTSLESVESALPLQIALNAIYIEGFLIYDNWLFFQQDLAGAGSPASAVSKMEDIIYIASETFTQAFQPALGQWIEVEPEMNKFLDNKIKSSALNSASVLVQKVRR